VTSKKSTSSNTAHEAVLSFEYPTAEAALCRYRALDPEVGAIPGDRSSATLDRDGDTITITVEARDLVALRAGLNTWSTLVSVADATGQCPG
jgi:KEOPS complex subunit Pcc1